MSKMGLPAQLQEELRKINALLRDKEFAISMADTLNAAYEAASGTAGKAEKVNVSVKEQKIAINLAGFYAVECGVGLLMALKGGTPQDWLEKIVTATVGQDEILVLDRFANATWKAGQPFINWDRIKDAQFISANYLPEESVQKDHAQVIAAASKLLDSLQEVRDGSKEVQLKKLQQLLRDEQYALEMAQHLDAAYYLAQKKEPLPFLAEGEDKAIISRSIADEQIAVSIAGFYALECGLSYFAACSNQLPSEMLSSIVNNSLAEKDRLFFERLANATWKAGQPFRGLDRITRPAFIPAAFLSDAEVEKDRVQIRTAAQKLIDTIG
jgi:hypothetical protein